MTSVDGRVCTMTRKICGLPFVEVQDVLNHKIIQLLSLALQRYAELM